MTAEQTEDASLFWTAPGLPEPLLFEAYHQGWLFQHGGAVLLGFGRRHIANGLQQQTILNPRPMPGS